jgi:uncharacterized protein YbcI
LKAQASDKLIGGELNAAVTREVIRVYTEAVGRGPKRAHSFYNGNVLLTVLEGTLSNGERKLAANGNGEAVRATKRLFHQVMDPDLKTAISELTGRKVVASLSDTHLDPDLSVALFILDKPFD